jgi:hypothetical protein
VESREGRGTRDAGDTGESLPVYVETSHKRFRAGQTGTRRSLSDVAAGGPSLARSPLLLEEFALLAGPGENYESEAATRGKSRSPLASRFERDWRFRAMTRV